MRRVAAISHKGGNGPLLARSIRSSGVPLARRGNASAADSTSQLLRSSRSVVPARAFNQWRGLATQTQPPPTASSFAQKKTNSPPQQKSSSAADSNIYEVNEANFLKEAIEASDKRVVLIDCYADWCAPCKQLAPLLEAAVRNSGGRLALAKLNVDNNPTLSRQMQVTSLPTVMALSGRKVVDSFVGLLKPAELTKFVEGLLQDFAPAAPAEEAETGGNLLEEAEAELAKGDVNQAAAKFSQALEKDKECTHLVYAGLARCALAENNLQAAQHLVKELKDKYKAKLNDPAVGKAIAAVELRAELADKSGGSAQDLEAKVTEWRAKLQADANDHQARYDLAHALFSTGQTEEALDQILDLIKRDKHWNDEAARKLMLKIFSALGPNNELTTKARKRFASIWFC